MDTEHDRMALKAVVFALHSRSETYNLGIKPDRAVHFLSKAISVSDECEKALEAAADKKSRKKYKPLITRWKSNQHFFQRRENVTWRVRRMH